MGLTCLGSRVISVRYGLGTVVIPKLLWAGPRRSSIHSETVWPVCRELRSVSGVEGDDSLTEVPQLLPHTLTPSRASVPREIGARYKVFYELSSKLHNISVILN